MPSETASAHPTTDRPAGSGPSGPSRERQDILDALAAHRGFLRTTVGGLSDEQARLQPTASQLCLGGIIKHVTMTEAAWAEFIVRGTEGLGRGDEDAYLARAAGFRMEPTDTLPGLLDRYEEVARRTDALVATLPSLDTAHPLPERPWFESGATRTARRVLVHIVAETAQHAGHADIIRESIDGATTMA